MPANDLIIDDEIELRWPAPYDHVFVEVHPFHGAWVASGGSERLYRMINGFREGADLLVELSELQPQRRRNLLYPVVFAYRQSLELHLKHLLMAYGPSAGEKPDFRGHSLNDLWAKCRRMVLFFSGDKEPPDADTFKAVDKHISEFDAADPRSDAFRFAHNRKGETIALSFDTIDLPNLRKIVAGLHNFLECVECELRYRHDVTPCSYQ